MAEHQREPRAQQCVRRDRGDVRLHAALGRQDGEDGGVRDGRANVAERGAAQHGGDAVQQIGGVASAELVRKRPDERQDDAHRPERRAARVRDDVGEHRHKRREGPARQPIGERSREEVCRLHVRDHIAESPREQQHEHWFEHILHPLDPRLHRLVERQHALADHKPHRHEPPRSGRPHERVHRVRGRQHVHQVDQWASLERVRSDLRHAVV
mmetsp:Transcript_9279/g.23102  ORF Transcript_9279/g.23102 Transcript_9279/m.23102 type:complete len:212 (-) Transcript_9279:1004-1639(-)